MLCTMAALCLPFGTGIALAEAVIKEDTSSIAQATPPSSQGDFVDVPVILPSPEGQIPPGLPVITEPDPVATMPQEPEADITENLPVIEEPAWDGDIGIVPPIADEILLPWVEEAFPPSLQVLQQEQPVVMAGDAFDLPLYIDFIFNGQSNVTNKGMDTGEALTYAPGSDALQRYDQAIAGQIDYAHLSLPAEWNENGALILENANVTGKVVDSGSNWGYAVVAGLQVPVSTQPGEYTLTLKVTWRVNAPLAEEQIVFVSIPYAVAAPVETMLMAGVEWGDGIIVYSHDDLYNAITNSAYSKIYLGYSEENQGTIAYQRRRPMPVGRNVVIDGTDPLTGYRMNLKDWNSSEPQDGMYASAGGISVTFQHIDLTVQNYYGIMYGTGQKNVNLTFTDVNFRGRQLAHTANTGSWVFFENCSLMVSNIGSGTEHEVLEAPNVVFYGNNIAVRTGPTDNSMFWLHGDSSLSFTVAEGASLTLDTTNYMIFTEKPAATTVDVYGDLFLTTAGPNGSVTYADQYIGRLTIHPEGNMIVQHNSSSTRPSLLVRDLTVSGSLEMARTASVSAVIRLEAGGSFVADNPSLILLDNPGGSILRSLGAATLRWNVAVINRYSGGKLASVWNRQDLAVFNAVLTHSGNNAVVQSVSNLDNDGKGAAIGAAALSGTLPLGQDTHLAMGQAVLSLDTVYGGQSQVTGYSASGAALTIAEYEYAGGKLGAQIQQQTATAGGRYTVAMNNAVRLMGSRVYAISDDGMLICYTYQDPQQSGPVFIKVPETLAFETVGLSPEDQLVHRMDTDWSIEVFDGRSSGEGFTLFASIDSPLATANGNRLEEGLVFVQNGQTHPLGAAEWPVYQSGATGLTTVHTIGWQAEEGLLVKLPAFEGVAGEPYTATITWTLAVGP